MANIDWTQMKTAEQLFEEKRKAKYAEIASARYDDEVSGIIWKDYIVSTDRNSRGTMSNAYQMLGEGESRNWKLYDKEGHPVTVALSKDELLMIGKAIEGHVQIMFDKEAAIWTQIEAAKTEADLDLIKW